ncbi:hypothetical protein YC2023_061751 [Brassica napus]
MLLSSTKACIDEICVEMDRIGGPVVEDSGLWTWTIFLRFHSSSRNLNSIKITFIHIMTKHKFLRLEISDMQDLLLSDKRSIPNEPRSTSSTPCECKVLDQTYSKDKSNKSVFTHLMLIYENTIRNAILWKLIEFLIIGPPLPAHA